MAKKKTVLFGQRKSRNFAFTLVDILISIFFFLFLIPFFLTLLQQTGNYLIKLIDYRAAYNRAFSVVSLLRYPIFYCGLGVPTDVDGYKQSFGNSRFQPFNWTGPVSVVKNPLGLENAELRIVFAKCDYKKLKSNFKYKEQGKVISFTKKIDKNTIVASNSGAPNNIKNCIVFRSSFPNANPLVVRWVSSDRYFLEVESYLNDEYFQLYKNDKMYLLSALKVFCKNAILYTNDYKISGDQPRVDGIQDIRFYLDNNKNFITIYILSRGKFQYNDYKKIIGIEKCFPELESEWSVIKSTYQLYVYKTVWRLPNCLSENLLFAKD